MIGEPARAEFVRQARAMRGAGNPERIRNETWQWLVRFGRSAYQAREHFAAQDDAPSPTWCFERFGMSATRLADGRIVCIGGEHEDHYDSDFFIYNDVVVLTPADASPVLDFERCAVEILGYATDAFPPTDSHSATRIGDEVVVIGGLGYPDERREGTTPVRVLHSGSFAFRALPTHGEGPSWLHGHAACYEPTTHSIVVAHGEVQVGGRLVPNEDTFRLHLRDGRWERIAPRTLRRVATPEHEYDPDIAAALRALGLPALQVYRSVQEFERWVVFCGDEATLELEAIGALEFAVEPSDQHPAVCDAVTRLLDILAAQTRCAWSLPPWRDGDRSP